MLEERKILIDTLRFISTYKHYISFIRCWQYIFGADTMRDKAYYEKLFSRYPDIVTISQLQQMLGGISEKCARKLLMQNQIKHYTIRRAYIIPKTCVIDYLLSDHYFENKHRLARWERET